MFKKKKNDDKYSKEQNSVVIAYWMCILTNLTIMSIEKIALKSSPFT